MTRRVLVFILSVHSNILEPSFMCFYFYLCTLTASNIALASPANIAVELTYYHAVNLEFSDHVSRQRHLFSEHLLS